MSGKNFLTPEFAQAKPPTPSPTKSNGQTHMGWERSRWIWYLSRCNPSTKWLARVHHVVVFKTKVLHFKIENTPIKETKWKQKVQKSAQIPCWGQTRALRYEIVFLFRFLHGGSECLACFEPTEAARFLKKLELHSVLYAVIESTFCKGIFYV